MASDLAIDANQIYLLPGRFGPATIFGPPSEGFTPLAAGTADPLHRPGTVCQVYNGGGSVTTLEGFSEFVYLQCENTSAPAVAAKEPCVPIGTASNGAWNIFTNDPDLSGTAEGGCALGVVALGVNTDAKFAWFWSGGICPAQWVVGLDGTHLTTGSIANTTDFNITTRDASADRIGWGPATSAGRCIIGCVLSVDTA